MNRQLMALIRAGWKNASPGELFYKATAEAAAATWRAEGHETKILRARQRQAATALYLVFHRPTEVSK